MPVGEMLAARLRKSTNYPLQVRQITALPSSVNNIVLTIDPKSDGELESYELKTGANGISIHGTRIRCFMVRKAYCS